MFKNTVSIFFTILFFGLITAPSIIIAIDNSVDISVFYSLSEEEEENKNVTLVSFLQDLDYDFSELSNIKNHLGYFFKTYPKPHLNLIIPPPEYNILSV